MRLSKQERIGVLIVLVVVIIAVGVFLFIVPAAQKIGVTLTNLENKQNEYDAAAAKAATKDDLRTQIINAYKDGEHLADMFFPEMKSYEADLATREFLAQCGANVVVTSLTVSDPNTATLATRFPQDKELSYDLKTYATQGVAEDESVLKRKLRIAELMLALGESQTVGASVVTFEVKAQNQEELSKFVDSINNYVKDENGQKTRKALMLTSPYEIVYNDVTEKYDSYETELSPEIEAAGNQAIQAGSDGEFHFTVKGLDTDKEEEEEKTDISQTYRTLEVTLVFYSIERMQDPEPLLDSQDGKVTESTPAE